MAIAEVERQMPVQTKKSAATGRDAEATKSRILDAAEEEFARAGLMGARTESIAANTGVTKAMIHYYFQDKERLYQAVLERCLAARIRAMQSVDLNAPDCKAALSSFITEFLRNKEREKNMAAIFMYEALQNRGKYVGELSIATLYEPLVALIRRGMKSGQFREMDPLHAAVNIIGMCVFYYCSEQNVKFLWPEGTDLRSPEMSSTHTQTAIDMALAAVSR